MYQSHYLLGLFPYALLCWLLAAISTFLHKKGKLKSPLLPAMFGIGFIGIIFLMLGLREYDDYRFRKELRDIPSNRMSHFCLSQGESIRGIAYSSDISELMSRIQSLKSIGAHHSSPINPFIITFEYRGQCYQYSIGRDSNRPYEYWVDAVGRGHDIGRIHSDDLGQIVQNLLANRPQTIK